MSSNYYYLDVTLNLIKDKEREISPAFFKKHIIQAVNQLFGEVGAAISVDLLKYSSIDKRAVLRVHKNHYVKLRSSLTLVADYEGIDCVYTVNKVAPLLLGLLGDSRNYKH